MDDQQNTELMPVGSECEFYNEASDQWEKGRVIAHDNGCNIVAVFEANLGQSYHPAPPEETRLQNRERDQAVRDASIVAGWDSTARRYRVGLEKLHDEGLLQSIEARNRRAAIGPCQQNDAFEAVWGARFREDERRAEEDVKNIRARQAVSNVHHQHTRAVHAGPGRHEYRVIGREGSSISAAQVDEAFAELYMVDPHGERDQYMATNGVMLERISERWDESDQAETVRKQWILDELNNLRESVAAEALPEDGYNRILVGRELGRLEKARELVDKINLLMGRVRLPDADKA